jgi:hypothetical protein
MNESAPLMVANVAGPVVAAAPSPPPSVPDVPLGWVAHWDADSKRHYFVSTATGETTWTKPSIPTNVRPPARVPAAAEEGNGASFQKYQQFRGTNAPTSDDKQAIKKKPSGQCLCRISVKSVLTHDWKPCLWVLETGNVLHVFRDIKNYQTFHQNTFLDEETRSFLLRAKIELTGEHR